MTPDRTCVLALALIPMMSLTAVAQEAPAPEAPSVSAALLILAGAKARETYHPLNCCDWGGSCDFTALEDTAAN